MSDLKPGIGRPPKYHLLIARLKDDEFYSCSSIAHLFRHGGDLEKRRILRAMAFRRMSHQLTHDRVVPVSSRTQKAYSGKQWKETVDQVYLSNPDHPNLPPESDRNAPGSDFRRSGGNSLKYDHHIRHLKPFRLYGPKEVADSGLAADLYSKTWPPRMEAERTKVENAAKAYAGKLPDPPDFSEAAGSKRINKAWFGWRWQLALPDEALSPRAKKALARKVKLHRFFNRGTAIAMGILATFLAIGFAVGPSKLMQGGLILKDQGPQAAYAFFAQGGETQQILYGRAWTAYRNQKYAESLFLVEKLLAQPIDLQFQADAHYLLAYINAEAGDLNGARREFEIAAGQYQSLGKRLDELQSYLGLIGCIVDQAAEEEESKEELLFQAELILNQSRDIAEIPLPQIYQLESRIAFEKGDYLAALNINQKTIELAEGDNNRMAQALSNKGFFLMLVGDLESGMETTREAGKVIFELGDDRERVFNLINEFLYLKCTGQFSKMITGELELWSAKDKGIQRYYEFSKQLDCSILPKLDPSEPMVPSDGEPNPDAQRVGSGAPDPPTSMGGGGGGGKRNH